MKLSCRNPLKLWLILLSAAALPAAAASPATGPDAWIGDLAPISSADWNPSRAAHLLERAGFGGTPADVAKIAAMTPDKAVRHLVYFQDIPDRLPDFDHSGVHDPGIEPFPPSRPAATDLAKQNGEAIGVKVKPSGNRRLQPVVDRFFYWLRASRLETHRVNLYGHLGYTVASWTNNELSAGHVVDLEDLIRCAVRCKVRSRSLALCGCHRKGVRTTCGPGD